MKLAVVMMQRDEDYLLDFWLTYHTKLFGAENVHVVDNGSTKPEVLERLEQARADGISVTVAPTREDFINKGKIVQRIGREAGADWVIPLDCDEFIGTYENDTFGATNGDIRRALRKIDREGHKIARLYHALWNRPGTTEMFYNKVHKAVFRADAPINVDKGFHLYDAGGQGARYPELEGPSRLAMLHYHNRHPAELLRFARYKLESHVPDFRAQTLHAYGGPGRHVSRYFTISTNSFHRLRETTWDSAALFAQFDMVPPFSTPVAPLTQVELDDLRDPINFLRYERFLRITKEEFQLWRSALRGVDRYYEAGSQATAAMACDAGVQKVVAVHIDINVCDWNIRRFKLDKYILTQRLEYRNIDIGDLNMKGRPIRPPKRERVEMLVDQCRGLSPNLSYISGRYRVASAAAAYLAGDQNAQVIVRDYADRPEYHALDAIFEPVATVGVLTLLKPRPGRRERTAERIRAEHLGDSL